MAVATRARTPRDKSSLLGKLLRINPLRNPPGPRAYAVPRSNPYVGRRGRNEIFARGLRNPWRFSFDGGRVLIGDVGELRSRRSMPSA